jgi:protein-L-isoaspartate(D-aspartate) O-methyltransferase
MPRTQEGLARLVERHGVSPRVVEAFRSVRREDFVPHGWESEAYRDRPIPIPGSQTTSQPSLIGMMIDATDVKPGEKVLEVGGGYGFQTALLAELGADVYSIDRDRDLVEAARSALMKKENVQVLVGDGWVGLPEEAPFDAIIVSAAAEGMPEALAEQLAEGGRLVIPLREPSSDEVWLFVKRDGKLERREMVSPARFVPLVRPKDDR